MHIAVIGAGVIGLAVARELALRGARVDLVETSAPGAGTTGTTFAWVNAHLKRPEPYRALNAAGVAAHHRLHRDLADGPRWFFPTGNLEWAAEPAHGAALAAAADEVEAAGGRVERLDPGQARALEPAARIPDDAHGAVLFADEGHVLPGTFAARLLSDALAAGVRLRTGAAAVALDPDDRGVRIGLDGGAELRADTAVTAAGRWTEALLATAGVHLPMADAEEPGGAGVGLLAYTEPAPARLGRVLTTPRLNVRPDGGGRLVLQGLDLDAGADPAAPPAADGPVAEELLARAGAVLSGAEFARVAEVRVGQRSLPADGFTVCGFTDDRARLYTVATHSGITLAPALGGLVADEVLDGRRAGLLAGFRPTRFDPVERPDTRLAQVRLPGQQ
ncbi:NAD(P)/FAD-dependent oxidoreductase [Nocardiopsis coralliicola]